MADMNIPSPNQQAQQLAEQRQQQLLKPRGALGRLEELACWFAARQGQEIPVALHPAITVFAADHGVAAQGVSAYPQSVTLEMLKSLVSEKAAIAVLARDLGAIYDVVDMGVIAPADKVIPNMVHIDSIARGTRDLSERAAMTPAQLQTALHIGARHAMRVISQGANLLIAGEVGIGNTTAAACLISAFTQQDAALIVGTGTGIDGQAHQHKLNIVKRALSRIDSSLTPDPHTLLAEYGGFEIAAMAGYYLQAARSGVPVLLDGFISTAAAIAACAIEPGVREWLLAAHQSAELGHALALEHLRLQPLLNLGLRLGEGSGAALAVPLLQSALTLHRDMATFAQAGVSDAKNIG
jgi:nicotinate-nucleotide--dimethylbenzimidazole phosphoribosyltransferase